MSSSKYLDESKTKVSRAEFTSKLTPDPMCMISEPSTSKKMHVSRELTASMNFEKQVFKYSKAQCFLLLHV